MSEPGNHARPDHVWKDPALANLFLESVRGGVPFAAEQIDFMFRVLKAASVRVDRFLDIGCGDGFIGRALLNHYAASCGTFIDLSNTMLDAARAKLAEQSDRVDVIRGDFGTPDWLDAVAETGPFDVIVSGFSIHHQPDARKRELYAEIFQLLRPGGMFLHHEHVAPRSKWAETAFDRLMIDSIWAFHQQQGATKTRTEIADQFVQRKDWSANILATVEIQCQWLREIGFQDVDCFLKAFEITLFGGRRTGNTTA